MTQYTEAFVPFTYNAPAQFLPPSLTVGEHWLGGWKALEQAGREKSLRLEVGMVKALWA